MGPRAGVAACGSGQDTARRAGGARGRALGFQGRGGRAANWGETRRSPPTCADARSDSPELGGPTAAENVHGAQSAHRACSCTGAKGSGACVPPLAGRKPAFVQIPAEGSTPAGRGISAGGHSACRLIASAPSQAAVRVQNDVMCVQPVWSARSGPKQRSHTLIEKGRVDL